MQSIEIKGYVYARRNWDNQLQFTFFDFEPGGDWFPVCEHKVVSELPAGFDPRDAQVAALQKQIDKARADFTALVTSLTEQLQSIQAIEYTPSEVSA
ncbi:hypothetical protein [Cupriavidus taiwanensis]|uniref:hypothetical protein n=1 Tax=Cupriavidus taiwanensis TaxID=164546 RepID=UPI000E137054|nr:hypothetical protein [Cupriavidus taiwanensis]SPA44638.1 hypothetical protein CBM2629_A150440 [Cupriavidus taiwanensis]